MDKIMTILSTLGTKIWSFLNSIWLFIIKAIGSIILVGIVLLFVISFLFSSDEHQTNRTIIKEGTKGDGEVVVLDLSGPIVQQNQVSDPFSLDSQVISSEDLGFVLDDLAEDPEVKGVILRINSPGGGVVASDEAYKSVQSFSERKPIVASISETAASGGYYIAVGADTIVAHPASIIGSIGVIGYFPNAAGLLERVGVDVEVVSTGQYKDVGSPHRAMQASERAMIQTMVDQSLQEFIQAVAAGRQMEVQQVEELADGRIVSGTEALSLGLVDELGGLDTAFLVIKEKIDTSDPFLTEVKSASFFDSLFSMQSNWLSGLALQLQQALVMKLLHAQTNEFNYVHDQLSPGIYYVSSFK